MKIRPLTGRLPRMSAPPAIDGIPIGLGRIRESCLIVASNASLPGKTTGFEKCRHMPSWYNPLPSKELTAMTAFGPFFQLGCAPICGEFAEESGQTD